MEEYLEFAKEIAFEAGKIMQKYFNSNNGATYKGDNTIVTLADKEINSFLIEKVKEKYPKHSVDGEEEMFGKSEYVWVCDPVDGTAMYARHIPVSVFSLALVIDGVSHVGVVYDVFTNNMYTAIKGKGAYKNDERIEVNGNYFDNMKTVMYCDGWGNADYQLDSISAELRKETYIVNLGSIIRGAMCVASGEFVAAIFPGTTRKNCDIAAVKVIVEEAGGIVTDLFGNEQRYDESINGALICNKETYNRVLETVKRHCTNLKN